MSGCSNRRHFLKAVGAATCAGMFSWRAEAAEAGQGAPHAAKLGWRLGCNAYCFNQLTFYEAIDKVASLGLKEIVGFNWQKLSPAKPDVIFAETMSVADRRETKQRLSDAGVRLSACYCRAFAKEDDCRRLFDFAKDLGMETLDGEPSPEAFDMLERCCDEYQINVAVHSHAKPAPYWKPETLLKLFEGHSKRIGACCDTGHWARSGLPAVETLAKLQGRIITFDLKDVNDQGVCVPFGAGKADIRGILKELHRQQFRGVFGIEYDQRSQSLEADLAQCVAYFDRVSAELSVT